MDWVDMYMIVMESHGDIGLAYISRLLDVVTYARYWICQDQRVDG